MDRLVANLLDMSRIEAGEVAIDLQPYALDDLIEGSISRFRAQSTGGSLAVDIPSDMPYVLADAILMDQVIVNLLDNAARHAAGAPVRVTASMENDRLRLIVEDGGPGVQAEGMVRLFDKFYQVPGSRPSARRGTGLGLAVVRGLVEAMGGQVDAHPSELGGLAISIALQISAAPSEDA
jgi:two-component system sensor histidine kinase KdpD